MSGEWRISAILWALYIDCSHLQNMRTDIHIDWTGPYTYDKAVQLKNTLYDFGVYQIYGTHPVYGADVLLYIGKADQQTFGVRLAQEAWRSTNADSSDLSVYVGRLGGYGRTPSNEEWSRRITIAERMLIVAHWPAGNASGLKVFLGEDYHETHVLNWGNHRNLLPEVSGSRYSDRFHSAEHYATFVVESE